jgi:hypothetical protein
MSEDESRRSGRRRSRAATEQATERPTDPTSDRAPEPDEEAAHLSEAARGVVRQSADPRLDAHLARMLSPDETAASAHPPTAMRSTDVSARDEVARLTTELADARAAAEAAGRRVVSLTLLLGVALLAIVILLVVALR